MRKCYLKFGIVTAILIHVLVANVVASEHQYTVQGVASSACSSECQHNTSETGSPLDHAAGNNDLEDGVTENKDTCPPWFTWQNDSSSCECRDALNGVVKCVDNRSFLLSCYCMSAIEGNATSEIVIGHCIYSCYHRHLGGSYYPMPDINQNNNSACEPLNRKGVLCSQCKRGFAPPVYSYDLHCVQCSSNSTLRNWTMYITVAYLPLTVFLFIVIIFRISVTSPQMNAFLLVSQILSSPVFIRAILLAEDELKEHNSQQILPLEKVVFTIYGIWNLDFFRTLYTPFCISHDISFLKAIALDGAIALYPLVFTATAYICIVLHDRGFKPLVWAWKPFHPYFVRLRRQWDIRTSIIDSFATFLVLSYVKLLSVSFDLTIPTVLHTESGRKLVPQMYLYYDANVEWFGRKHCVYAITAVFIFVGVIVPLDLFLILYPLRCTQRFIGKCRLRCHALKTFADVFQGFYKDGTDGTRDCRYFSAVYLIVRLALCITYAATLSLFMYLLLGCLALATAALVAVIRPYKKEVYNNIDTLLLLDLGFGFLAILSSQIVTSDVYFKVSVVITAILASVPLVYLVGVICHWILIRKMLLDKMRSKLCNYRIREADEERFPPRLMNADLSENAALLSVPVGDGGYGGTASLNSD